MKSSLKMRLVTAKGANIYQFSSDRDLINVTSSFREDFVPSYDPLQDQDIPELKKQALRDNFHLKKRYTEMVLSGKFLSEEDFWMEQRSRQALVEAKSSLAPPGLSNVLTDLENCKTLVGTDEPGDPKRYVLTVSREVRVNIFASEPWVKEAFDAYMKRRLAEETSKQAESAFWGSLYKAREKRNIHLMAVKQQGVAGERTLAENRAMAAKLSVKSLSLERFMELYGQGCFGELSGFGGSTWKKATSQHFAVHFPGKSALSSNTVSHSAALTAPHSSKPHVPLSSDLTSNAGDLQAGGLLGYNVGESSSSANTYEDAEGVVGFLQREGPVDGFSSSSSSSNFENSDRVAEVVRKAEEKEYLNAALIMERNTHSQNVIKEMERRGAGELSWAPVEDVRGPIEDLIAKSSNPNSRYQTLNVDANAANSLGFGGALAGARYSASSKQDENSDTDVIVCSEGGGGWGAVTEDSAPLSGTHATAESSFDTSQTPIKMLDLLSATEVKNPCESEGCKKPPAFGFTWGQPKLCSKHKLEDMENVVNKRSEKVFFDTLRSCNDVWEGIERTSAGFSLRVPKPWAVWVIRTNGIANELMSYIWGSLGGMAQVGEKRRRGEDLDVTKWSSKQRERMIALSRALSSLNEVVCNTLDGVSEGGPLGSPPVTSASAAASGGEVQMLDDEAEDSRIEVKNLLKLLKGGMEKTLTLVKTLPVQ